MTSVFPSLLSWSELSPFIIRITLAIVFIFFAFKTLKNKSASSKERTISIIEGISGLLLFIGLWTQVAALVIVIDMIVRLYFKKVNKALLTDGINYYLILLAMALSLLFSGAGLLGIDLRI